MMLQHRYEQALALAERSVALHEAHGSGHGLAVALATLGQICVRLGDLGRAEAGAAPRARSAQPDSVPRNDRRGLRHAGADSPDSRPLRRRRANFSARASEAYGAYGRQTSQWYEWSVRVLGARLALRRGALRRSGRARRRDSAGRARRRSTRLQATLIAAEALIAGDRLRRSRAAPRRCRRRARSAGRAGRLGRVPAAARRAAREARAAAPTRITTSRRARRCSICSASAIRRRSATSRSAGWSPRPARARSPSVTSNKALAVFEQLGAERDLDDTHAAQALLTAVGTGEYVIVAGRRRRCDRAADCGCGGAAGSARPRNGGGAARSDRRRLQRGLRSSSPAATSASSPTAGCDADAARALARAARHGSAVRSRRARRRAARPRSGRRRGSVSSPRRGRSAIR